MSPNFYEAPHLLTTLSVSATCHAKLQTFPHPITHSAADYGSWFSPKMCSSFCSWVCLRSDEPLQGSFESMPRPPLHEGLGTLVWSAFGAHPSATAAFSPAQTNHTKRGKPTLVRFNTTKSGRCESTLKQQTGRFLQLCFAHLTLLFSS